MPIANKFKWQAHKIKIVCQIYLQLYTVLSPIATRGPQWSTLHSPISFLVPSLVEYCEHFLQQDWISNKKYNNIQSLCHNLKRTYLHLCGGGAWPEDVMEGVKKRGKVWSFTIPPPPREWSFSRKQINLTLSLFRPPKCSRVFHFPRWQDYCSKDNLNGSRKW